MGRRKERKGRDFLPHIEFHPDNNLREKKNGPYREKGVKKDKAMNEWMETCLREGIIRNGGGKEG